uniref:Uncharacterized protein n=1 Tax=Arundo donax TaxID=35708 RepID=A0A0A9BRG1_ARUDO
MRCCSSYLGLCDSCSSVECSPEVLDVYMVV